MSPKKPASKPHRYLFKALWGGTALKFWIEGHTFAQAERRAKRYVAKMEGCDTVIDLELVKQE